MHDPSSRVPYRPGEQGNGDPGGAAPFEGFDLPESNFWRLPNNWFDLAARFTSWAEHKVVEYILRHTWGYHEYGVVKLITMDEFMHGRKRRDGSRLDAGCGMAENSIKKGINDAVAHGFLIVHTDDTDKGRIKKYYAPRMRRPLQDEGDHALTLDPRSLTPQGQTLTPTHQQLPLQSAPLPLTPHNLTLSGAAPDPRTEQDPVETHSLQETSGNNTRVVAFKNSDREHNTQRPHSAVAPAQPVRSLLPAVSRTITASSRSRPGLPAPRESGESPDPGRRRSSTLSSGLPREGRTGGDPAPRRVAQRARLHALPATPSSAPASASAPSSPTTIQRRRSTPPAAERGGRPPAAESDLAQTTLVERLIAEGVAPGRARALVQQAPADRIERQLAWIDGRSYRNRAATLVAAIEGDFSMPLPRQGASPGTPLSPDRAKFYRGQYALCPRCGSRPCAPSCEGAGNWHDD